MKEMKKTSYNPPAIKVVAFQVENGFQSSPLKAGTAGMDNGTQQFNLQSGDDSWTATSNTSNTSNIRYF